MYEVEVKVPADHDTVRDRLSDLGAERVGAVEQVDTYYDAPHRSFAETDEALRVRAEAEMRTDATETDATRTDATGADENGGRGGDGDRIHELTYKGPKVEAESKTRQEHETRVGDPDAVDAALDALGFERAATVEKERERFRLDGYTVTLDAVDGLGEFVEVEREASEDDVAVVRKGAFDVLEDLDLDPDDQVRTSYLGLLLDSSDSHE